MVMTGLSMWFESKTGYELSSSDFRSDGCATDLLGFFADRFDDLAEVLFHCSDPSSSGGRLPLFHAPPSRRVAPGHHRYKGRAVVQVQAVKWRHESQTRCCRNP